MQLFSAALISIAIILCMGLNGNFQSSLPCIMHKNVRLITDKKNVCFQDANWNQTDE